MLFVCDQTTGRAHFPHYRSQQRLPASDNGLRVHTFRFVPSGSPANGSPGDGFDRGRVRIARIFPYCRCRCPQYARYDGTPIIFFRANYSGKSFYGRGIECACRRGRFRG